MFNIKAGYSRPIAGVVKTIKNVSFCYAASKKEQMFDFSVLLKMFVVYYKAMFKVFFMQPALCCPYGILKARRPIRYVVICLPLRCPYGILEVRRIEKQQIGGPGPAWTGFAQFEETP